jgi:holo-[acyl-carrier protein] synthase
MGIGTDIVEIGRIRQAAQKHPGFWQRILTPAEEAYCRSYKDGVVRLAGRFAAKEAVMKCLGVGMDRLSFTDIEIINDPDGSPRVNPGLRLRDYMNQKGIAGIEISISHCRDYATAVALSSFEVMKQEGGGL